ncbi:MAG: succinate dehydrogenase [Saccharolobus sp.]
MSEEIKKIIESEGGKIEDWISVSERPGKEPFAIEANYSINGYFWGKIHIRNEGDLYVLIISKDVFNWKQRIKDLKLSGEVVDAVGGLMWISEPSTQSLEKDFKYLKSYIESLKKQKA